MCCCWARRRHHRSGSGLFQRAADSDYCGLPDAAVQESRERVQAARDIQNKRFAESESSDIVCNADMLVGEIRKFCKLQDEGQSLMRSAMSQMNLFGASLSPHPKAGTHDC